MHVRSRFPTEVLGRLQWGDPTSRLLFKPHLLRAGLLEIFDREWADFYVWTVNGSVVFRVERDPAYWALLFPVLSHFWWQVSQHRTSVLFCSFARSRFCLCTEPRALGQVPGSWLLVLAFAFRVSLFASLFLIPCALFFVSVPLLRLVLSLLVHDLVLNFLFGRPFSMNAFALLISVF